MTQPIPPIRVLHRSNSGNYYKVDTTFTKKPSSTLITDGAVNFFGMPKGPIVAEQGSGEHCVLGKRVVTHHFTRPSKAGREKQIPPQDWITFSEATKKYFRSKVKPQQEQVSFTLPTSEGELRFKSPVSTSLYPTLCPLGYKKVSKILGKHAITRTFDWKGKLLEKKLHPGVSLSEASSRYRSVAARPASRTGGTKLR